MAGGAPDVGEQLAAAPPVPSQLEGGGGCQQAHERVRQIELLLIDLRLGHGIDARRIGLPPVGSSVRTAGVVMPLSARNAPALNSSSAGTNALRPNRPTRPSVKRLGRPAMPSWFLSSGSA